jgi:hypothetical protein
LLTSVSKLRLPLAAAAAASVPSADADEGSLDALIASFVAADELRQAGQSSDGQQQLADAREAQTAL